MKYVMTATEIAEELRKWEDLASDRDLNDRIWRWVHEQKINPRSPGWQYDLHHAPDFMGSLDAACSLIPIMHTEDGPRRMDFILEHINGGLTIGCRVGNSDPDEMMFGNNDAQAVSQAALAAHIRLENEGAKSLPLTTMQALLA